MFRDKINLRMQNRGFRRTPSNSLAYGPDCIIVNVTGPAKTGIYV